MRFGTLKEYFEGVRSEFGSEHLNDLGVPLGMPVLSGNFFTYAMKSDEYWSGYYTSRPHLKLLGSLLHARLRAAELLFTFAAVTHRHGTRHSAAFIERLEETHAELVAARRASALFLHHDTITGTSAQHVMADAKQR